MPTMPKPTDEDREFFRSLVPDDARVEVKPMFGSLGAFVNGNMFLGLFGSDVGVKLDDAGSDELLAEDGAGPFGPAERPVSELASDNVTAPARSAGRAQRGRARSGYVSLPPSWRSTPERAAPWVERALAHVGALPPKQPKARKRA